MGRVIELDGSCSCWRGQLRAYRVGALNLDIRPTSWPLGREEAGEWAQSWGQNSNKNSEHQSSGSFLHTDVLGGWFTLVPGGEGTENLRHPPTSHPTCLFIRLFSMCILHNKTVIIVWCFLQVLLLSTVVASGEEDWGSEEHVTVSVPTVWTLYHVHLSLHSVKSYF